MVNNLGILCPNQKQFKKPFWNHSYSYSLSWFSFSLSNPPYFIFRNPKKGLNPFHPLVNQLFAMYYNESSLQFIGNYFKGNYLFFHYSGLKNPVLQGDNNQIKTCRISGQINIGQLIAFLFHIGLYQPT